MNKLLATPFIFIIIFSLITVPLFEKAGVVIGLMGSTIITYKLIKYSD